MIGVHMATEGTGKSGRVAGFDPAVWRWALAAGAGAAYCFEPSSGLSTAMMVGVGVYGAVKHRRTLASWRNPAGMLFGLGVVWAVASWCWSFHPAGTARDLAKAIPLALAVWGIPAIADRPSRIWGALMIGAAGATLRLGADLARLAWALGWPEVMTGARFHQTYLYTHPNVSSMVACLCVFVFAARWVAGAPGWKSKALLAAGIAVDLAYVATMGSRGPQAAFALAALLAPAALAPGWRSRLAALGLAAAFAATAWPAVLVVNPRFGERNMVHFNRRDTIWGHAKLLAGRRPALGYGYGKKAFSKAVYENPEQRAPLVPFRYPHAHSYWLMLSFQGGRVGLATWSLAWLALAWRLGRHLRRASRGHSGFWDGCRARALPVLLALGMGFVLFYGVVDYPDHLLRHALYLLAGLAMALTRAGPGVEEGGA